MEVIQSYTSDESFGYNGGPIFNRGTALYGLISIEAPLGAVPRGTGWVTCIELLRRWWQRQRRHRRRRERRRRSASNNAMKAIDDNKRYAECLRALPQGIASGQCLEAEPWLK